MLCWRASSSIPTLAKITGNIRMKNRRVFIKLYQPTSCSLSEAYKAFSFKLQYNKKAVTAVAFLHHANCSPTAVPTDT